MVEQHDKKKNSIVMTMMNMHVKKSRKNVAVFLMVVVAAVTTTLLFYLNHVSCAITASSQSMQSESSYSIELHALTDTKAGQFNSVNEPLDVHLSDPSSSVQHAANGYTLCRTRSYQHGHEYKIDRTRHQVDDSTSRPSYINNPGYVYDGNSGSNNALNSDKRNDNTLIYFVTPTYPRREQIAELTRLGQTLMHVPHLHWIVADDRLDCNLQMINLLNDFSIPYTYIASPMPVIFKRKSKDLPRGVSNRRAALNWVRLNHNVNNSSAVIYFGDDDNTFHLDLFKEIRTTKKISMFPVGLVGDYSVSSPIIDKGKVVGFFDGWPGKRKFAVDMAGFAINIQLLFKYPFATMPYKTGFEEDRFLSALAIQLDEIEPKADNCTRILVWHTQTKNNRKSIVKVKSKATLPGSLATLLDQVTMSGMAEVSETTGIPSFITKNGHSFQV